MANQHSVGYKPIETVERYKFTTDDIREFLQGRIEAIGAKLKQNPQKGKEVADCQLVLISHKSSDVFYPLLAILPENVIKQTHRDPDMPDIFWGDDEQFKMVDNVYGGIYAFAFTKAEKNGLLKSSTWRNSLKLSSREASWIAKYSFPRVVKIKGSGGVQRYVIMLLDPVKIFREMVKGPNDVVDKMKGPNFDIEVHAERMNGRMCRYEVQKSPKKNKRRQDKDIEAVIEAAIKAGN